MNLPSLGNLKSKLAAPKKLTQVSPNTGGGQRIVEEFAQPTTVVGGGRVVKAGFKAPPNAATSVLLALGNSNQVAENTETTAGTGHGKASLPVSKVIKSQSYFATLAVLAALLIAAVLWDKGAL